MIRAGVAALLVILVGVSMVASWSSDATLALGVATFLWVTIFGPGPRGGVEPIRPSPQFVPPVMNLDGPALALRSVEQPEPDEDLVIEEFGSFQPIVVRGCQHECEPVEVEYFPGRVTIVGWVCTKCWREFR